MTTPPILASGIEHVSVAVAKTFVRAWHYSETFPPHCLLNLGARDTDGLLAAVAIWGYGVRPLHTIRGHGITSNLRGSACGTTCPGTQRAGSFPSAPRGFTSTSRG
jgi:hypothetical protein